LRLSEFRRSTLGWLLGTTWQTRCSRRRDGVAGHDNGLFDRYSGLNWSCCWYGGRWQLFTAFACRSGLRSVRHRCKRSRSRNRSRGRVRSRSGNDGLSRFNEIRLHGSWRLFGSLLALGLFRFVLLQRGFKFLHTSPQFLLLFGLLLFLQCFGDPQRFIGFLRIISCTSSSGRLAHHNIGGRPNCNSSGERLTNNGRIDRCSRLSTGKSFLNEISDCFAELDTNFGVLKLKHNLHGTCVGDAHGLLLEFDQ